METTRLLHEKAVTHRARGFFDGQLFLVCVGAHLPALDHRGQVEAGGRLLDDIRVGIRVGTQLVVEVRHDRVIARLSQDPHQTQAIRAAGYPHNNRVFAAEPALFLQNGLDVFEHYKYLPRRAERRMILEERSRSAPLRVSCASTMSFAKDAQLSAQRGGVKSDTTPPARPRCFPGG